MEIKRISSSDPHYPFMEELLVTAFPKEERRDLHIQREFTDHNQLFHCNILTENNQPIGILTYWTLADFIYIEHFAIDSKLRNKGYGSQALKTLVTAIGETPIILEAEEPTDETSRRRIDFYCRQGFALHEISYLQPPYRNSDGWLPLKLMSYGRLDIEGRYTEIRDLIYKEVYQEKAV